MDRLLKNPPLKEVEFVIQWEAIPRSKKINNLEYQSIPVRLQNKIKNQYSIYEQLKASGLPEEVSYDIPQHKFIDEKDNLSYLQLGSNILTVNSSRSYEWKIFKDKITSAVESYYFVHPDKGLLRIKAVTLKYENIINLGNIKEGNIYDYLLENFNISFNFDNSLLEKGVLANAKPISFDTRYQFEVGDPGGFFVFRIATGDSEKETEKILLFDIFFQSNKDTGLPELSQLSSWLEFSHEITEECFFDSIKDNLMRKFR